MSYLHGQKLGTYTKVQRIQGVGGARTDINNVGMVALLQNCLWENDDCLQGKTMNR